MPQRKVTAGLVAGSLSTLICYVLKAWKGIDVPAEAAVAVTTLFTFGLQYLVPNEEV
jgi:hypothetical protein